MWLSRLHARGFAGGDPNGTTWELDAIQAGGSALLLDAVALFAAGLSPARRAGLVDWLDWHGAGIDGEEIALDSPAAMVEPAARPALVVEADIQLDPPLFGRVREAVMRDPERAMGLADGTITARVGWQFVPDRTVTRVDLLGIRLGSVPIPLSERPAWVDLILADVGERIDWVGSEPISTVAMRVTAALLSDQLDFRQRARAVLDETGVEVVVRADRAEFALAGTLHPVRWGDPGLVHRIRLAEKVLLGQPDVLLVGNALPEPLAAWVAERTTGDDAVLEQVISR